MSNQQRTAIKISPLPFLILLAGLILVLLSCGIIADTEVRDVDIRGTIVEVHHMKASGSESSAILGAILLEGVVEEDTVYNKASIAISRETTIIEQRGTERIQITFDDVTVGQRAEAHFAGPVKETFPLQGTAAELVILSTQ